MVSVILGLPPPQNDLNLWVDKILRQLIASFFGFDSEPKTEANLFSKKKIEENLEFTSTHQVEVPKKEGIKPGIRKKKGDASDE